MISIQPSVLMGLLLWFAVVLCSPAYGATPEQLVQDLSQGSFSEKAELVQQLAASGDPRVVPALQALLNGRLYKRKSDERVVLVKKRGKTYLLYDPLSGNELAQAGKSEIKKIRVNNSLRREIRTSLGSLNLFSEDASQRARSAEAVFKARPKAMETPLQQALERETDPAVRDRIELALAALRLDSPDAAVRTQAAALLGDHPRSEVKAMLAAVLATDGDGNFVEPDSGVREAASAALDRVENSLAMWLLVEHLFQGLSLGSVLLLAAIGLAITFGVMGVINMAHGEMVMLGAYSTYIVQELFRNYWPHAFDVSVLVAIPVAFLFTALVGLIIERGVIRHLYGRPLETLLATWGISLILQQSIRSIFGPTNQQVANPSWMSGAFEIGAGVVITYNRIWIVVFSLLVFVGILLLLRGTRLGLSMRAVTQNRPMAASMGIHTGAVDALTFAMGSGIAGMAGVALSQIDNVSPNLGQSYIIDSFMVVVFGGVGNLWGTLVGAFSLGILNKFLEPWAGAVLGKILVLVGIILFIQKRPRGLFALKGRAVEA